MWNDDDLFYVYAVCTETVYNRIFGLLPIWPYRWRRIVARRISDYLNANKMPRPSKPTGESTAGEINPA